MVHLWLHTYLTHFIKQCDLRVFSGQSIETHFPVLEGASTRLSFFLQPWIPTYLMLRSTRSESGIVNCLLYAVFDYIQQTVTAVRAQRRHTVLIYVNEIYSPFTSAWQTYSSLKTSSSFQWKKELFWRWKWDVWILQVSLLNGCIWLVCTVLGRGGQRLPFLITLRFWGVLMGGGGDDCKPGTVGREAGTAGFPEQCSLGDIQLQRCPERNRQEGSH